MLQEITKKNNPKNPFEGREGLVYARVSSKRQETEGTGLQSQEGRCIKELEAIGVPYIKTYPDSYSGGGDYMNRPEMREMLAYIDANPHKKFLVIFDDLKRFARDTVFHFKLRAAFRVRDVALKCLNYDFDDGPEGVFTETVFAAQGQLEREQNKRQVIQKQKSRLELGYWAFSSKKPYKMEKDPIQGKILKPQYPEAEWLKEALEGFAFGRFVTKVDGCKFLVEKGYWKKRSPEKYTDEFTKLLRDVLFAGYIEKPEWGVERREGHHKPLIDLDTYELIQKRLKNGWEGKRIRKDLSEDFPLRGLSMCFHCSHPLTGAWSRGRSQKYAYYFCQNKKCLMYQKVIRRKDIEDCFAILLKKQVLKDKVGLIIKEVFDSVWKEESSRIEDLHLASIKRKVEYEEKLSKFKNLAVDTKSETVRRTYEDEIENLAYKIDEIKMNLAEKVDLSVPYRTALDIAIALLKNPYKAWQKIDLKEQHGLFYFIFDEKLPYDLKEGYRTAKTPTAVKLFEEFLAISTPYVDRTGIEPVASSMPWMRSTK